MGISKDIASDEGGFSLIETVIVIVIVMIMTAAAVFALYPARRAYRSEDAANKIVNYFREAYQRALAQRQAMRVRIDRAAGTISIIDEGLLPDGDEATIKREPLVDAGEVSMDRPTINGTVVNPPPAPYNYAPALYTNNVWEARFLSDGSVSDASASPAPLSATFFFWPTKSSGPNHANEIRAVTLFGPSGSIRYWRHDGQAFVKEVN